MQPALGEPIEAAFPGYLDARLARRKQRIVNGD
jgi:hypothetical protein